MSKQPFCIFGIPLFGVILPFIGWRRIPLNRDGSFVDTGEMLLENERGFYYVEPFVIEWMGAGLPLTRSQVRLVSTGEIVDPDFDEVGP